ncbi:hypothetical protein DKT68_00055 [Micromonospora acroterricola]|uniref:Methane oxygenase PmoA n=1 Tax=Micromonospora acroterricola TaxID=2202421 RepID=A0A317DHQ8_9ACTN|nr:hypothetical protein DKT68_00055 [Micromonospora acroterricola]
MTVPGPSVATDAGEAEPAAAEGSARLLVDGTEVARYVLDPALDARHGPRPYLHPVRTLAGTVVTDALPADHVWHLGASLAVQDVNGANLWGGRTYVRDVGYTWRDDHGRIAHTEWSERADDRLAHRLEWRDRQGTVLLTERRQLAAVPLTGAVPVTGDGPLTGAVPLAGDGPLTGDGPLIGDGSSAVSAWLLEVDYTLSAPPGQDVRLGSPATNGRPGGAGYGGFFWRAGSADRASIFSAAATGEEAVNGSSEPWVALRGTGSDGRAYTLVFTGLGDGDRWFVRAAMYPGVGVAFAFERPVTIPAGTQRRGRHRVVVADGALNRATAAALASSAR